MDFECDFTDLNLPRVIDTSSDDLMEDFYIPLLSRAKTYRRGVGYFTTNWVRSAARGVAELANNGGTAQWIMSPILEEEDWKAIRNGASQDVHALELAIWKGYEETRSPIIEVAVAAEEMEVPCGRCLQVLEDYASNTDVSIQITDGDEVEKYALNELLA